MQKLKQYSLVLACVISLFASSFAACVCSLHHKGQAKTETSSGHHHAEEHETSHEHIDRADADDESVTRIISEHECGCFLPATLKTGAKSETVKLDVHLAALPEKTIPETIVSLAKVRAVKFKFAKPLYLSDSFYNLAPGRAPPGL